MPEEVFRSRKKAVSNANLVDRAIKSNTMSQDKEEFGRISGMMQHQDL